MLSIAYQASGASWKMGKLSLILCGVEVDLLPFTITYRIQIGLIPFALAFALISSFIRSLRSALLFGFPSPAITLAIDAIRSVASWSPPNCGGPWCLLESANSPIAIPDLPLVTSVSSFTARASSLTFFRICSNGMRSATHKS